MSDVIEWSHRFITKFTVPAGATGGIDCWEWTGALSRGYGSFSTGSRHTELAHRLSYRAFRGEIPQGACVLHRCDNRRCVNPTHLFLGTYLDNNRDMITKQRDRCIGERNTNAKLTRDQVDEIRLRIASGESHRSIAAGYGIRKDAVSKIATGRTWSTEPSHG